MQVLPIASISDQLPRERRPRRDYRRARSVTVEPMPKEVTFASRVSFYV